MKKLSINKETLLVLNAAAADMVAAGGMQPTSTAQPTHQFTGCVQITTTAQQTHQVNGCIQVTSTVRPSYLPC